MSPTRISAESGEWEMVVGLEVHAQIITDSKLFSGASTAFGAAPNHHVSLVDAAMPGMLPVINGQAVAQAVRTGLGLNAKINLRSIFERKNYFYPDLPQGYQISQYMDPVVGEGELVLDLTEGRTRKVGIERLHMEQDAGKSLHDQDPRQTYIDLNRSGVALMEIVSKPDIRDAEEAGAYLRKLRSILRYLGTCDGNMEEGSMRCDVNISVRPVGETALRTRTEIKNVNSVKFVMAAVDHEAHRQVAVYEDGGEIVQETRLFDSQRGETRAMRSKEHAHDYRYFPDPDLPPLLLTQAYVDALAADLPELPDAKKQRFVEVYDLTPYDAGLLVSERETADYFEAAAAGRDAKQLANWITTNLFGALNKRGLSIDQSPVSADHLGRLVDLIGTDVISGRTAKEVFEEMLESGAAPDDIVDQKGLRQVSDVSALDAAVQAVIDANPKQAQQYRDGNTKVVGWFVGQVMAASKGKANPGIVNKLLKAKLGGD